MDAKENLKNRLAQIKNKVTELNEEINQLDTDVNSVILEAQDESLQARVIPSPPPLPSEALRYPQPSVSPQPQAVLQTPVPPQVQQTPTPQPITPHPIIPIVKKPFIERYPSLEIFVGAKLITFLGIILLVTGIGFFVSYAIEHNWINETARTAIGILAGGLLIGTAHFLRKNYRAFSSILLGGGIAVLYFSIGYAYHIYHLFPQMTAFAIMIVITVFAVISSLAYNRMELAIIALVGGFMTPLALQGNNDNYMALFTYLLVLDIGMTVISLYRNWKPVHFLSFLFTSIIFSGWLAQQTFDDTLPKKGALLFASAFFIVFFIMNLAYNFKNKLNLKWISYIFILLNSMVYFSLGLFIVELYNNGIYSGLFTLWVAVFHFIFIIVLYRNNKIEKNIIIILIGLVLSFVTLAAPIQLNGNHITLFWAAEAVLLLWFGQRTGIRIIKGASFLVSICMLFSLMGQWGETYRMIREIKYYGAYSDTSFIHTIVLNGKFMATLAAIASVMLTGFLLKKETNNERLILFGLPLFTWAGYRKIFPFVIIIVTYIGCLFEIQYQLTSRFLQLDNLNALAVGIFNLSFALGVYLYYRRSKSLGFSISSLAINIFFTLYYFLQVHPHIVAIRNEVVDGQNAYMLAYLLHYICTVLILTLLFTLYKQLKSESWAKGVLKPIAWYQLIILLLLFSSESDHLLVTNFAHNLQQIPYWIHNSHRAGYPVLWGVLAFVFIYSGMKVQNLHARLAGMIILIITLIKIFAFDVWEMTPLGRIISFVSLGILVLIISFTYQKLTKIIFDDKLKEEASAAGK